MQNPISPERLEQLRGKAWEATTIEATSVLHYLWTTDPLDGQDRKLMWKILQNKLDDLEKIPRTANGKPAYIGMRIYGLWGKGTVRRIFNEGGKILLNVECQGYAANVALSACNG